MGHHTCCNRQKVKRGLWSPEEDEKLINYISTYGHGCWSSVPTLAGLQRCGKSCRLRWVNYLRPDLKRRSFSPQEAAVIIELHRSLGNRWAQIAKHLPGRTDNEVKNFWNSSIKKKLIPHGLSDFPTFSDIPNTCNASFEGFFLSPTVSTHPNLIPSPQQHHIYIPNTSSILPQGFAHHGDVLELDDLNYIPNFNFGPMPPLVPLPSHPPSYDPTCSLAYHSQHHINHDDHRKEDYYMSLCHGATASTYFAADQVVNFKMTVPPHDDDDGGRLMMPKLCEIMINSCMPSSSVNSHEAHPMASSNGLSCFPQETYTHDPHQPNVQTEYIDAIISSIN